MPIKRNKMYAVVTPRSVEFFDVHLDAFEDYNELKEYPKGVFTITSKGYKDANISANHWNGEYQLLTRKLEQALEAENEEL